jgi:DNA-binding HxlR family transcriptional regulator
MTTEPALTHRPLACDATLSRVFTLLGKRWNGVLIATLASGTVGFSDLKRAVAGISDSMLSERLTELAKAGIVDRTVDTGPPVSVEYQLTDAGLALLPALDGLSSWAATNWPEPKKS